MSAEDNNDEDVISKGSVVSFMHFLNIEKSKMETPMGKKIALDHVGENLRQIYKISILDYTTSPKIDILHEVTIADQKLKAKRKKEKAKTHNQVGMVDMRSRNFPRAIKEFTSAINIDPFNAVFLCNRAEANTYLLCFTPAIRDCRLALQLNPKYARAYNRLGIIWMNLKKWREAVDAFENCVKYDNNYYYIHNLQNARKAKNSTSGALERRRRQIHRNLHRRYQPLDLSRTGTSTSSRNQPEPSTSSGNNSQFLIDPRLTGNMPGFVLPIDGDQDLDPCGPYFFLP